MKKLYSFADVNFEIDSTYEYFSKYAQEYEVNNVIPKHKISTSIEEIKSWKESHDDCEGFPLDYLETLVLHAKIADILSLENKFIFHGSSIFLDSTENGFIFTAPSGTGKTTHVRLLIKALKDRITYINDDKPFIFNESGSFTIYGSPWNGKERLSNNVKAHLRAIFVITRGNTNKATKLTPKEAISYLVHQIHMPKGMVESTNATNALVALSTNVDVYKLEVNMNDDAYLASYEIMNK